MNGSITRLEERYLIVQAVDKPIERMRVDDICRAAGVSKPTFYRCFQSKYDILPWWIIWSESCALDGVGRNRTWEEGLIETGNLLGLMARSLAFYPERNRSMSSWEKRPEIRHREKVLCETASHVVGSIDCDLESCIRAFAFLESETILSLSRSGSLTGDSFKNAMLAVMPSRLYELLGKPSVRSNAEPKGNPALTSIIQTMLVSKSVSSASC